VYGWGGNVHGQLAHGDRRSRPTPVKVDSLKDKRICRVGAGNGFSIFCSTQGIVMACGNKAFVGGGDSSADWLRPKIVDMLLREDIIDMSCGDEHVLVLCQGGDVYGWGNGEDGRLGTGSTQLVLTPTKVMVCVINFLSNILLIP